MIIYIPDSEVIQMEQAYKYLIMGELDRSICLYEEAIALAPEFRSNYAYLGLAMLLQGQEADAQMIWFNAIDDPDQLEDWAIELASILNLEAERYENQANFDIAWLIRQHIAEIAPDNISNLAESAKLSLLQPNLDREEENLSRLIDRLDGYNLQLSNQDIFSLDSLLEQSVITSANKKIDQKIDQNIVKDIATLDRHASFDATLIVIESSLQLRLSFLQIYLHFVDNNKRLKLIRLVLQRSKSLYTYIHIVYAKTCLQIVPKHLQILIEVVEALQSLSFNTESVEYALRMVAASDEMIYQIGSYHMTMRGLLSSGCHWQKAQDTYKQMEMLMEDFIGANRSMKFNDIRFFMSHVLWSYYLQDHPRKNRLFISQAGDYYQAQIQQSLKGVVTSKYQPIKLLRNFDRKIRIAYISQCLNRHSVGWISRWLINGHDHHKFDTFVYFLSKNENEIRQSIQEAVTASYELLIDPDAPIPSFKAIADQIQNDRIDILIDLDSLTNADGCVIMALKPAPIQVSWLGSDATGIPAIDYFIADPYVLPEDAQDYYNHQIVRLPQAYVAVNGFEVGTPNLKRADLDIPQHGIVYLSVQAPHKRNPDFLHCQMQILRQVPHSYLLLKSSRVVADYENLVLEIANSEGISPDRIKFLPTTPTEETHRANLAIADVILDTYPYTGATTTLEALWMELPIVTRVGESFVSRNSYTMILNAGISEGIAWSDQEYIDWGVRLGNDPDLRQQTSWKLKKSKQTAPLWDVPQFVSNVEAAYEQMWTKYVESQTHILDVDQTQLEVLAEAELQNSQGIALAQQGEFDRAIACFNSAIAHAPEYAEIYYNLGITLTQAEKLDQAIASFEEVIKLQPDYADAYFNLGLISTQKGNDQLAIHYLRQAIERSPHDFEYHLTLANLLSEQGNWQEALTSYESAAKINPNSTSVYYAMGLIFKNHGNYSEAISNLRAAIRLEPEFTEAICQLMSVLRIC